MADWTTIPDSSIEPGKPIRSIDGLALRDNPIAIAEGATGAPKILAAGLATGTNERDWVLARTAAADYGAVGTYVFAHNSSSSTASPGATIAGSSLNPAGVTDSGALGNGDVSYTTPALSGTWRCMGYAASYSEEFVQYKTATLWLRIA